MTKRTSRAVPVAAALAVGLVAGYLIPKPPHNRNDCYLRYVGAGMTNNATGLIWQTCNAKFPMQAEKCRPAALADAIDEATAYIKSNPERARRALFLAGVIMDDCE